MSNLDWAPTFLAAAGEPDVKQKLLKGHKAAGKTFEVYLDGYDFLPYLTGKEKAGPRVEFFDFSDDGDLLAGVTVTGRWPSRCRIRRAPWKCGRGSSGVVGEFLATFTEYPPRQKAASFTIDQVLQKMQAAHGG